MTLVISTGKNITDRYITWMIIYMIGMINSHMFINYIGFYTLLTKQYDPIPHWKLIKLKFPTVCISTDLSIQYVETGII